MNLLWRAKGTNGQYGYFLWYRQITLYGVEYIMGLLSPISNCCLLYLQYTKRIHNDECVSLTGHADIREVWLTCTALFWYCSLYFWSTVVVDIYVNNMFMNSVNKPLTLLSQVVETPSQRQDYHDAQPWQNKNFPTCFPSGAVESHFLGEQINNRMRWVSVSYVN